MSASLWIAPEQGDDLYNAGRPREDESLMMGRNTSSEGGLDLKPGALLPLVDRSFTFVERRPANLNAYSWGS
jgi:hypothetical protein